MTSAGVWVIDTKRYKGKRAALRVDGSFFRPRTEHLIVGGREQASLLAGMAKQLAALRSVTDVPVTGALCFVDADWPMFGGSFRVDDVLVLWPNKLAQLLRSAEGDVAVAAVTNHLDSVFRPA